MSRIRSHFGGRQVAPITQMSDDQIRRYAELVDIGINLDPATLRQMMNGLGMDAADTGNLPLLTGATASTPLRFLQHFLPGLVRVMTAARKIDTLVGITTAGSWEDQEVVQGIMEPTGLAQVYGDYTNIPLASYNPAWETRDIVRGEKGMQVGRLEEARAAKMNMNAATEKRAAAALALEIFRNRLGFYGFNDGGNRTYGFLNEPSLLPYISLPAGAGGSTTWASKTFLEITADIRLMAARLRAQGMENIDPYESEITLAVASASVDALSVTNELGTTSVREWIRTTYPRMRVESAVELNGANGGLNVVYMYAESVADSGTDDERTMIQIVPAKLQPLGVEKRSKSYIEDWTNASAGVIVKRPYAVVRASGA